MSNRDITIEELQNMIAKFCKERDWDQFHNPKDLAIGISTEASELLELFRFKDEKQSQEMLKDPKMREKICDEFADVMYFALRFAQMNKIDVYDALSNKIGKNEEKYPVEKSKSNNKKYDEYWPF
ncbi:MAG: nucleotide pyrophosphohydrolase [Candidatus Methanogranum gryphiswaldense]|jgi:NTP pyrophosphatase (non-canonical NTP hydrolase)|nr:MAG: nucleotide pyrophosphohydrolase [Candidatus Methanogranum sp. U3.2.1]